MFQQEYNLKHRFLKTLDDVLNVYSSNKISFIDINSFIYKNWNNEFTKVHVVGKFNFILNTHLVVYSIYFLKFRLALSFIMSSLKFIQKPKILICGTPFMRLENFNDTLLKKLDLNPIVRCFDHRFPGFLSNKNPASYYLRYFEFYKHGFFTDFFSSSIKKSRKMLNHHIKFYTNPNLLIVLSLNRDSSIGKASLSKRIPSLALSSSDSFNFGFSGIAYTIPFPYKNIIGFKNNPLMMFFFLIIKLIHSIHLENRFSILKRMYHLPFKIENNISYFYNYAFFFLKDKIKEFSISYCDLSLIKKARDSLSLSSLQTRSMQFYIQRLRSILISHFISFCLQMAWHKNTGLLKRRSSQLILFEKNNSLFANFFKILNLFKLFNLNFLNLSILTKKQEKNNNYSIFSNRKLKVYYSLRNFISRKWKTLFMKMKSKGVVSYKKNTKIKKRRNVKNSKYIYKHRKE